jgi:pimeloyl-ACP methyl ester carboxylesterase
MPVAALDDVDLHYEDFPGTEPPLLLVAGIPVAAGDWSALIDALDGRRVIAYDNRGGGTSGITPGPYTTAQLADDAAALLDALGVAEADVFGVSLGGMIAQELALRHPGRVRRLVLGGTRAVVRGDDAAAVERLLRRPPGAVHDRAGHEAQIAAALGHDTTDRLGAIACPTLVLASGDDPAGALLAERIPGAELHVLPGAGPRLAVDQPVATAALLDRFL